MKILMVFGSLNVGGAEKRTLNLIEYLSSKGKSEDLSFYILCLSGTKGSLAGRFESFGVRIIPIKLSLLGLLRIYRNMKLEKYDVVHSNVLFVSALVCFLAYVAGIGKRIAHIRTTSGNRGRGFLKESLVTLQNIFLDRILMWSVTDIVLVSEGCRRLSRSISQRGVVIYNGISPSVRPNSCGENIPKESETIKMVLVGRMIESKNHVFAAYIVKELIARKCKVSLKCLGRIDIGIRTKIIDVVGENGSIEFVGEVDSVNDYFEEADILLLPSLIEGLPGVLIEGYSYGLGCISSPLSGSFEIQNMLSSDRIQVSDLDVSGWCDTIIKWHKFDYVFSDTIDLRGFTLEKHANSLLQLWKAGV